MNYRDSATYPYPIYETNMLIKSGASGGPVFGNFGNDEFVIIGINSGGFSFEDNPVSYVVPSKQVLEMTIKTQEGDRKFIDFSKSRTSITNSKYLEEE